MGFRQMLVDLRELRESVTELVAVDEVAERAASYDLTVETRRFTRKTKAVVDDKLSFSATLMRAGEVEGANRLLEEVEQEVRTEEAALLERVNEVKVARAVRKDRITRLRLARTLAVAMLGATMMTFSALGVSLASMLSERATTSDDGVGLAIRNAVPDKKVDRVGSDEVKAQRVRKVPIAGMMVALNATQLKAYFEITSGAAGPADLENFLSSLPAGLVAQVEDALTTATAAAEEPAATVEGLMKETVQTAKKKAAKAKTAEKTAEEADETDTEPQPSDESPSPDDDDDRNGGDDANGGGEDTGEDGLLPDDSL